MDKNILDTLNGEVIKGYGVVNQQNHTEFHRGVDIASPKGTRLDANVSGKVIASGSATSQGYHSSYGNIVVVQDDSGQKHLYANLDSINQNVNSEISKGDVIGLITDHLHYEVHKNGKCINPLQTN